jgi:endonuclease-3
MPALTEIAEQTKNPFHVLISCILSLRTKDATTAKASERLFALADNPYDMAKLSTKAIEKAIFPVGFYRTKAKRIKVICKKLIDDHHGKVPDDFDLLMKFHGVGRKTANIVMVYGFNKLGIPVDTHVHRVSNRIGWVRTKTPEKTEFALRELLPERYWMDINDLLVQFGQNICRPVRPQCNACPVSKYCLYYKDVYLSSCNSGKAR